MKIISPQGKQEILTDHFKKVYTNDFLLTSSADKNDNFFFMSPMEK